MIDPPRPSPTENFRKVYLRRVAPRLWHSLTRTLTQVGITSYMYCPPRPLIAEMKLICSFFLASKSSGCSILILTVFKYYVYIMSFFWVYPSMLLPQLTNVCSWSVCLYLEMTVKANWISALVAYFIPASSIIFSTFSFVSRPSEFESYLRKRLPQSGLCIR